MPAETVTLTGVRCEGCGASFSPEIPRVRRTLTVLVECPGCGRRQSVRPGERDRPAGTPRHAGTSVVVGAALTEIAAALEGVASHGRALEIIEALRRGSLAVDHATLERLATMGFRQTRR